MDFQSKDGTDTDTDSTDERFPLISLFVDDVGAASKSPSRMDRVVRGAALIMSHWPQHTSSSVFLFNVVLCLVLLVTCALASLAYLCSVMRADGGHVATLQAMGVLGSSSSCDYVSPTAGVLPLADVLPRSTPQPPTSTVTFHQHQTSQVDKLFYAHIQGDNLTAAQACAIESAVRTNPNVTCYILVFMHPAAKDAAGDGRMNALAEKYSNIHLLTVDGGSFFRASPLQLMWEHLNRTSSLLRFAARVMTAWQYGGTSYGLDLFSVRNKSVHDLPNKTDVVVVELTDGLILSSRVQCHAFLFEVMKVLASVDYGKPSVGDVLSMALVQFCTGEHISVINSSVMLNLTCPGVMPVPTTLMCEASSRNDSCVWATARDGSWPTAECPVTAHG